MKSQILSEMGPGYVPCEVSGRYLKFELISSPYSQGEFIRLAVMTGTDYKDGIPIKGRCLCTLILERRDLERALSCITPTKNTDSTDETTP
jgi:hypothetical protein